MVKIFGPNHILSFFSKYVVVNFYHFSMKDTLKGDNFKTKKNCMRHSAPGCIYHYHRVTADCQSNSAWYLLVVVVFVVVEALRLLYLLLLQHLLFLLQKGKFHRRSFPQDLLREKSWYIKRKMVVSLLSSVNKAELYHSCMRLGWVVS